MKNFKKLGIAGLTALSGYYFFNSQRLQCKHEEFPTYTKKDVSKHASYEDGLWVSYRDGVYDVTKFARVHPGGEGKILMVAGGPLDVFWEQYAFHKKPETLVNTLEPFRIGNLDKKDRMDPKKLPNFDDQKKDEYALTRNHGMVVVSQFPWNGECPPEKLMESFYTPGSWIYVRNHNSVPKIDLDEWRFTITDPSKGKEMVFTFDEIKKKYPFKTMEHMIQCVGNKRQFFYIRPGYPKGIFWNIGAVGNGVWGGAPLKLVLEDMGFNEKNCKGKHLICKAYDKDFQSEAYEISIPMEYAFDPKNVAMLCYSLNGRDLPHDHGYPMRLLVPGFIGARNCKWIASMEVADAESEAASQRTENKMFFKDQWGDIDPMKFPSIYHQEINSCIIVPQEGKKVQNNGKNVIQGWAYGTYGVPIKSVQISFDEGKSWKEVTNLKYTINEFGKNYGWTRWTYDYPYNHRGPLDIWVIAEDMEGHRQPYTREEIWNIRGFRNNAMHRIKVDLHY